MSGKPKRRIRTLERRMAFLEGEFGTSRENTFSKGEYAALAWAIPILCEASGVVQVTMPTRSMGDEE